MVVQVHQGLPATQVLKAAQELGKFRGHLQVVRLAPARLAKLVNAVVLKTTGFGLTGSSPVFRTM